VTTTSSAQAHNPPATTAPAFPLDAPRNVAAFTADTCTFVTATYFIPATTVLVGLASQLTDDKALIGVVGMTWSVSWFLPQLFAAQIVRGRPRQKPYLMIPSIIGRTAFLLIALWLLVTQAQAPILTVWVLIGGLVLFNINDALAGVAWFDMMSRTLSPRVRARVVSVGQFVAGVLGIGVGILVERVLAPGGLPFPQNYAFIFGCAYLCMMLSLLLISFMRETPMAEAEQQQAKDGNFIANLRAAWRTDALFRKVLIMRALTGIELMAASFYLVFAKEQLGVGNEATGIFNIALIIGGIAGVALFGWLADRFTSLSVIRAAAIMQLAAPLIALTFALTHMISPALAGVALIGFFVVFVLRGAIEHSLVLGALGYLLDSAPQRHRAMYVGAINTLSGLVAMSPVIAGLWINVLSAQNQSLLAYVILFCVVSLSVLIGLRLSFKLPKLKAA
jgi:MFS family permease